MKRINKRQARKAWNDGQSIIICPCNLRPNNYWNGNTWISKSKFESLGYDTDFDKIVDLHTYYNCTNSETGKYCAYYIAN